MRNDPSIELSAEQYLAMQAGTMGEAEWRRIVKDEAVHHGWEVLFELPDKAYSILSSAAECEYNKVTRRRTCKRRAMIPVMTAIEGWPDLLLGHPIKGVTVAFELKTAKGTTSPGQRKKLSSLDACGIETYVLKPGQLDFVRKVLGDPFWKERG